MLNRHVLVDLWVDNRDLLARVEPMKSLVCRAAEAGGATILHSHFYQFSPAGMTGFLLLAESHISIHTWYDEGFAALDVFTCGSMDTDKVVEVICEGLRPSRVRTCEVDRGSGEEPTCRDR